MAGYQPKNRRTEETADSPNQVFAFQFSLSVQEWLSLGYFLRCFVLQTLDKQKRGRWLLLID